jgi:hypothetical protein
MTNFAQLKSEGTMSTVKQAGSFVDARGEKSHRVFCIPEAAQAEILQQLVEESDFVFYNLQGNRKVTLRPYDLMVLKDGALEAAFTNDGELVFMEIGTANPEDQ